MSPALHSAIDEIVALVRGVSSQHPSPRVVAIDGPSGAGKSSLAQPLALRLGATVVATDDFFAAEIPDSQWDVWTPEQRAARVVDWPRLRIEALGPLLAGKHARWHPFDFAAGPRADGSYSISNAWRDCAPAPVILLEGAYSGRPEMRDVIDLAILVDAPRAVRHARLRDREEPDFLLAWHKRWDAVEDWYFAAIAPSSRFDLVVSTHPSAVSP